MAQSIHLVVGIKTSFGKFFNCEKFNFQLSCNAAAIRQKQTFVLEPTDDGKWFIRSWLNKHLSAHELGEVSIKTDGRTPSEKWTIEFLNGLVALKSSHGKYLTADENNLICKAAAVGDKEKFELVFSIHPQIVVRSFEGRFVRADGDDIIANKDQQFGIGTLITLEYDNNGRYAFKTVSGRYMSAYGSGNVKGDKVSKGDNEYFTFELQGKKFAIKSSSGKYLSPDGVKGNLKAKSDKITARELFEMFHSDPQITMKAHNKKFVSCQERNIMCNRTTVGDDETFIMEHVKESVYALRTIQAKYWSCINGAMSVSSLEKTPTEQFNIGYQGGKTWMKTVPNAEGKAYYITAKSLGGVRGVNASEAGDQELFEVHLLNRPQLVLRTKQLAFVGTSGDKIMANKNNSETFTVEFLDGSYLVRNTAGNYFSVGAEDKIVVVPEKKTPLFVEFVNGRLAFKTDENRYLVSDDHGNFVLGPKREVPPPESQFEF
jgi:hypothetical protein